MRIGTGAITNTINRILREAASELTVAVGPDYRQYRAVKVKGGGEYIVGYTATKVRDDIGTPRYAAVVWKRKNATSRSWPIQRRAYFARRKKAQSRAAKWHQDLMDRGARWYTKKEVTP